MNLIINNQQIKAIESLKNADLMLKLLKQYYGKRKQQ